IEMNSGCGTSSTSPSAVRKPKPRGTVLPAIDLSAHSKFIAANFPRFAPERKMYSTSQESKFVTCPVRIDASQKLAPIQPRRLASISHDYVIDRGRATRLCVNHANRRPEFNCCGRDFSPRPVADVTRSLENVAARSTCTECRDHNCVARLGARGPASVGIVRNRAFRRFGFDGDSYYRYPFRGVCSLLCALRFGLREGRRSDERADKRDQYLFHSTFLF